MAQIGHVSPTRPFDLAWAAQRPLFSAQLPLGETGIGPRVKKSFETVASLSRMLSNMAVV